MSAGLPSRDQETLSYPKSDIEAHFLHMNDHSIALAKQ